MLPKNYEDWKHCITVNCGIALTANYLQKRLDELQDEADENTKQFAKLYGREYINSKSSPGSAGSYRNK